MSKKIVIIGYSSSVHVVRWARGLSDRGFNISVISLGGKNIEGVKTIIFPRGKSGIIGYIKYLKKVKNIINNLRPDLVHAHYASSFGFWGYYSKFHPFIISVWGSDIVDFPSNFIKRRFLEKTLKSADHISVTSKFLERRTMQLYPKLESRISIIPFGINIPDAIIDEKHDNMIRLVFIKVHREIYGPDILLLALKKVVAKNPRVHLTLAGEGELTDKLQRMTKELELEKHVDFCGFIDNQEIFHFLSKFDIMVMPSLKESFGVAVLEASAVGLPVIAGDVGGVPEVLISEKTGILVPPGDVETLSQAIIRLADNADLRKRMGFAGRKFVAENYRWDKCLDMMADMYERIISGELMKG